jgi:hypothetical protein
MNFKDPLIKSDKDDVYYLAPIPVYMKQFDDHEFHDRVYNFGFENLDPAQKLMGQELPDQYDFERQSTYHSWNHTETAERWVENTEYNPIGSRFSVPPNDFLKINNPDVGVIRQRIFDGFSSLLNSIEIPHDISQAKITESWMQYYDPYAGRGHQAHNHCRWHPSEEPMAGFSGGYYLSDGEPIKDHPYSGVFCFHIRGMSHFIRPKKGLLVIWPYDIVHSVKPFYGKTHRCVINFNIQIQ